MKQIVSEGLLRLCKLHTTPQNGKIEDSRCDLLLEHVHVGYVS